MKRLLALIVALMMLPCASLAENVTEEEADHTLIVATLGASVSDPRLEYAYFSRYPDGQIVYMAYGGLEISSVQLMAGMSPDLILFYCGHVPRYIKADIIEDLYEQVFPDGYPETLAPQARHLMELDGKMVGMAEHWMSQTWSVNKRYAEKLGYDIPDDGWTEQDLIDKYFSGYTGDTDGDGEQDVWFATTGGVLDAENVPIMRKLVYIGAYEAILTHANDIDYLLSEDFLKELELSKLLTNSEKLPLFYDENGYPMPGIDHEKCLFYEIGGGFTGPYRAGSPTYGSRIKVPRPAFLNGESNDYISANYYCLMRSAPHHDLAVEVMRMMASEEYQSIYDGSNYSGGKCFGAKEPTTQITGSDDANNWQKVAYSETYHADVRIVDASALGKYRLTELTPEPEAYEAQLEVLAGLVCPFYDSFSVVEVCETIFWPAFKEYCEDNITAEEVAQLLYQRLRIAMYE